MRPDLDSKLFDTGGIPDRIQVKNDFENIQQTTKPEAKNDRHMLKPGVE